MRISTFSAVLSSIFLILIFPLSFALRIAAKPTAQAVTATKPVTNGTGIVLTSGALTVRIEAPVDGATVKESPVEVKGQAPAGTVISINDLVLVVKADRVFSAKVKLEQGPNLIEFLASDIAENQVFTTLAIYYEP